jgi:hypothetical protein
VEDSDLNRIEICGGLGSAVEDRPSSFRPRLRRTRISIRAPRRLCGGSALKLQATTVTPRSQSTAALGGPPGGNLVTPTHICLMDPTVHDIIGSSVSLEVHSRTGRPARPRAQLEGRPNDQFDQFLPMTGFPQVACPDVLQRLVFRVAGSSVEPPTAWFRPGGTPQ